MYAKKKRTSVLFIFLVAAILTTIFCHLKPGKKDTGQ